MFTIYEKYANGKMGTELAKPQKISTIYITAQRNVRQLYEFRFLLRMKRHQM